MEQKNEQMPKTLAEALTNKTMPFLKMETDTLIFKLVEEDPNVLEEYKIWDNAEKKWYKLGDTITATTGEDIIVEKTKFLNQKMFENFFPQKRRSTQFVRTINVDGLTAKFGFKKTANDALNNLIGTIKSLGNNPYKTTFLMKKTGKDILTKYSVSILPLDNNGSVGSKSVPEDFNTLELEYLNSFRTNVGKEYWTLENFLNVAVKNEVNISKDRLNLLFKELKI